MNSHNVNTHTRATRTYYRALSILDRIRCRRLNGASLPSDAAMSDYLTKPNAPGGMSRLTKYRKLAVGESDECERTV